MSKIDEVLDKEAQKEMEKQLKEDSKIQEKLNRTRTKIIEEEKARLEEEVLAEASSEGFFDDNNRFIPKRLGDRIMKALVFKTIRKSGVYVYDSGFYHNNGEVIIENFATRLLGEKSNSYRVNETISYIGYNTYISIKDINADPNFINLTNGVFDIGAGKLVLHNPDIFMITQLPIQYNPKAKCPRVLKFLHQIINKEDIPVIQEIIGYCLLKAYPIHKAVMFIGEGSNGKSTLLNLIKEFLGKENIANISLQDIDRNRFAGAMLFGKLANIYNDVSAQALYQTGKFKMLTGNDTITAEQKFKDGFPFVNYAKLLFSTNRLPETRDDTDAFYRRWIFISFPNKFEGKKNDPDILKKTITPGEISGLFNWAMEGLKRLLKNGDFSNSKSTEDIRDQYERLSSPIHAFVKDMIEVNFEAETPKDLIYRAYSQYCKEKNLPAIDKAVFGRRLPAVVPNITAVRKAGEGRIRCWKGIKLINGGVQGVQEVQANPLLKYNRKSSIYKIKEMHGPPGRGGPPPKPQETQAKFLNFVKKKTYKSPMEETDLVSQAIKAKIIPRKNPGLGQDLIDKMLAEGLAYRPTPGKVKAL